MGPSGETVYTHVHCTTMYDYVLTITKNDKSWMIKGFLKAGWVFMTGGNSRLINQAIEHAFIADVLA